MIVTPSPKVRCAWVTDDPLYIDYHDCEWGVPVHDDNELFEVLILEGAQAGLSWLTILRKREYYRAAFDEFNPFRIAQYDDEKIKALLTNPRIVRNRLKIEATVINARAFLEVQREFGSFDVYIWNFVGGQTIFNSWKTIAEIPSENLISKAMSHDLKRRNFKFVGSTICYAFMQACGLVHDHIIDCFCYRQPST
jgi:DNA-3-methyladenine glycosylase I